MRGMNRIALAAIALAGCTAAAPAPSRVAPTLASSTWAIESIDGKAVEAGAEGDRPGLSFAARGYSAYAGCNAMGGLYAQRGTRLYTLTGVQTAMGCGGARGQQERIVALVLQQAPAISGNANRVTLRSGSRSLGLRRVAPSRPYADDPEAWQGSALAGQAFEMTWVDGNSLSRRPAPRLDFAARTVTISHLCGNRQTVRYRQSKGGLVLEGGTDSCMAKLGGRALTTVSGPNGELLLAGNGHWLGGHNTRRDRPK